MQRARKNESQEMRAHHDSGHGSGKARGRACVITSVFPRLDQSWDSIVPKETRGARGGMSGWVLSKRTAREDWRTLTKIFNKKRVSLCQLFTLSCLGPPDLCSACWDVQHHSGVVKLCLSSYPRKLGNEFQPIVKT